MAFCLRLPFYGCLLSVGIHVYIRIYSSGDSHRKIGTGGYIVRSLVSIFLVVYGGGVEENSVGRIDVVEIDAAEFLCGRA